MSPLPVDSLLPEIIASVGNEPNLVIEAPPGAGKTTRVPPALLRAIKGEVWVLEPRRLAVRLAARHVAAELGETLGETVGYQVRFEQAGGRSTRLRYLTEGVLTRRIASDPQLRAAGIIILDEFHERHLDTDLALALLKRLQRTHRPDLRLVVMSATLDAAPIAGFLGQCRVLRSEGRLYPMRISYRPHSSDALEEQVRQAVAALVVEGLTGDVLVFLPGAGEIQRAARAIEDLAARHQLLVTPLHGDLSPEEQDRAVTPAAQRKIILSTNVAESSVTIEGVTAVIDSGLARIASHSPWSGLPQLKLGRISKASATQRAGRSARTAPGRVIRLYPEEDFLRRPEQDTPELLRTELSETLLALESMGIAGFGDLDWLDAPPPAAVDAARDLLARLGAADCRGQLTETGRAMAQCPLPPRLARLVVEADRRGVGEDGALAAALLSLGARLPREHHRALPSDIFALMEAPPPRMTRRLVDSIRSSMRIGRQSGHNDDALRTAILSAFPDRVARRRQRDELLLSGGGSAVLSPSTTVRDAPFLVAIDIEERQERGLPLVRLASAIEPDWLLDLFPDRVEARSGVEWNRTGERVESVSALVYDGLVIEESRGGAVDPAQAAPLLAAKARETGLARFIDETELAAFRARVQFASQHSAIAAITDDDVWNSVEALCAGLRSFRELEQALKDGGLVRHLESTRNARLLEEIAPARLKLPSGRTARIEYADGQPPRAGARLQEFFGMHETPRIARGQVPLVLLLLAPSQRPVQTTSDLKGFWEKWYPQVRRELMRRYPKHAWPENPG